MTTNTNKPASTLNNPRQFAGKAPSKEQIRRNLRDKANAKAAKALPTIDMDKQRAAVIDAHNKAEGSIRVYAMALNARWAEQMAAFRCHWTAFTKANCRSDNEKAVLAAVEEERKALKTIAEAKGHVNPDMPWSRTKTMAKELFSGSEKREREPKPLDERQKTELIRLYKAGMKEERPSEVELAVNEAIGKLLVTQFKVDLSSLNV